MKNKYIAAGLMSGTSLDGIDLAICSFIFSGKKWRYNLLCARSFNYSKKWRERLAGASLLGGRELIQLDREYGTLLASVLMETLDQTGLRPELVASHGHTVFHEPAEGMTFQIGSGAGLASASGLPVICDFRSLDVALGGQGAPLVPAGDKYLFYEYDACLNLGGFSNISFDWKGERVAFDICPVNIALNMMASKQKKLYDRDGSCGRKGKADKSLLSKLDKLAYYSESFPKSLSREWLECEFVPLLLKSKLKDEDIMATLYHHIAGQIREVLRRYKLVKVLVTGGGTHNTFLLELIRAGGHTGLVIPGRDLIDYKEAIVFAFLGVLRFRGEINCFSSVTGAARDSSCGIWV